MSQAYDALKPYLQKRRNLHYLLSVLNYDLATKCPKDSLEDLGDLMSQYETEYVSISKDPEFIALVKQAAKDPALNPRQAKLIREEMKTISFMEKVSLEKYREWMKAYSKSNEMWREYKEKSDFASWLPYWEKCIAAKKEECALKQKPGQTLYDVCLDNYEPGSSEKAIDEVFAPLKEYLLKKIPEAMAKQATHAKVKIPPYSIDKQAKLSLDLLKAIDYDMDRGAIAESEHPFSDGCSRYDARVTTNYNEKDYRSNLFSVIHEGGHCLEFQNWPEEQYADYVEGYATAAICETHSRMYENIFGRSKEFAPTLKALCAKDLSKSFLKMSDEDFTFLMNQVEPIPNRCDSDELTYSMHIIIRYEIEKELINGRIACKDVPALWNQKYKEYLGVDVPNDKEGCMQDIHWTDGEIGYFPSYALGNIYGAAIVERMKKDIDVAGNLKKGNLHPIKQWLAKNDFAYDYLDPKDWILKVTGEEMNAKYFIDYLNQKY